MPARALRPCERPPMRTQRSDVPDLDVADVHGGKGTDSTSDYNPRDSERPAELRSVRLVEQRRRVRQRTGSTIQDGSRFSKFERPSVANAGAWVRAVACDAWRKSSPTSSSIPADNRENLLGDNSFDDSHRISAIPYAEEPDKLFEDLDTEPGSLRLPLQSFAREPHDGSSHSRCMTNCGTTRFHPATNRPLPASRFSK